MATIAGAAPVTSVSASVVTPVTAAPVTVPTPPAASSPQSLNADCLNGGMEAESSTAELSVDVALKVTMTMT